MKAEEVKPYHVEGSKGQQVEEMFDSIAPAYDFMNTAMTFGLHRRWLRKALGRIRPECNPENIIDLATGTGEVAFKLALQYPEARILGVDLSEGMLRIAREKMEKDTAKATLAGRVEFEAGDCLQLEYPAENFDILTIAYGVRNFESLEKGFREFYRILKPGGKCMILELSRPENLLVRVGYDIYSKGIIPLIGRLVSKDRRAYRYLPESIAAMPPRRQLARMLVDSGFKNVEFKSFTMGVVTCYIAEK